MLVEMAVQCMTPQVVVPHARVARPGSGADTTLAASPMAELLGPAAPPQDSNI